MRRSEIRVSDKPGTVHLQGAARGSNRTSGTLHPRVSRPREGVGRSRPERNCNARALSPWTTWGASQRVATTAGQKRGRSRCPRARRRDGRAQHREVRPLGSGPKWVRDLYLDERLRRMSALSFDSPPEAVGVEDSDSSCGDRFVLVDEPPSRSFLRISGMRAAGSCPIDTRAREYRFRPRASWARLHRVGWRMRGGCRG